MRHLFDMLCSPSRLFFWETAEFFSIILVIIGCWGEGWAEHHAFKDEFSSPKPVRSQKERWKRFFWKTVIIGLAIEMIAFGISFVASNREIEGLRSNNVTLQSNLTNLQVAQKPRWQRFSADAFNKTIAGGPTTNIEILYAPNDENSSVFAVSTERLLIDAGWKVVGFREFSEGDAIPGWEKEHSAEIGGPRSLSARVGAVWGEFGFLFHDWPEAPSKMGKGTAGGVLRDALRAADMPFHDVGVQALGNSNVPTNILRLVIPPSE
jgi:hypothetical protein